MSLANVGSADRIIRIVVGAILIAAPFLTNLAIWENQTLRILILVIGVVLLLTGLFKFCGMYKIFGIRTN